MEIQPNPASEYILIKDVTGTLMIYNSLGVRMFLQNITASNQRIDIGGLPRGVYAARLVSKGEVVVEEFEKI